jgi:hypothetical protein
VTASFDEEVTSLGEVGSSPDPVTASLAAGIASPNEDDARLARAEAYLAGVDASVGDLAASRGGGGTPLVEPGAGTAEAGP